MKWSTKCIICETKDDSIKSFITNPKGNAGRICIPCLKRLLDGVP